MDRTRKVLVLDDDVDMGWYVCETARGMGVQCTSTAYVTELLGWMSPVIDLVVLDLVINHEDIVELLKTLGKRESKAKVLLISSADPRVLDAMRELGVTLGLKMVGCLQKPLRASHLEEALRLHLK